MVFPHHIDFKKFVDRWAIESSRKYFQKFVFEFLRIKYDYHSNIKEIREDPGDWGIDVICGDFNDQNTIWQCKFFIDKIGKTQQGAIRKSYNTIIRKSKEEKFEISKWILCIPIDLSAREEKWWNSWKKKMENKNKIPIGCLKLSHFKEKHKDNKFQGLLRKYFLNGDVLDPDPEVSDDKLRESYENWVFIENIKNSDITADLIRIKRMFYTAEFFETDIMQKNSDHEIRQLNTVYHELSIIWENFHNIVYSSRDDDDGNDVYNQVCNHLIKNIQQFQKRFYNLSISALIGLVFKLSDDNKIHWTRNLI